MACVSIVFILLMFVTDIQGVEHLFLFDNPDVFERCPGQPKDVFDFNSMFDLDELTREMDNDMISVSGNLTVNSKWKIDPSHRIMVHVSAFHWEVGVWQPTIFNLVYRDFCKVFYKPNEYWYIYLTQHITNANEVKDKCIKYPGTKLILSPFEIRFVFKAKGTTLEGRYKVEYLFEIFDEFDKQLPLRSCFMTSGEFVKIKT